MTLFLIFSSVLFVLIFLFYYYKIKRARQGFRFRARLLLIMLLMTIIPAAPMLLVSAGTITKVIDFLVQEYPARTFDNSLEAIRLQLQQIADPVLDVVSPNMDIEDIAVEVSRTDAVAYVYKVAWNSEEFIFELLVENEPGQLQIESVDPEMAEAILAHDITGILQKDEHIYENYRVFPDSIYMAVGLKVDPRVFEAITLLENSSAQYGFLTVFTERQVDNKTIYGIGILILLILVALAFVISSILARYVTGPIKTLVDGFEQVGQGDLNIQVDTNAKDELEGVLRSFNKMTSDLRLSQQKLIQSERLAAWRDVARQISHEIKNPLTPIQLSLHRLKNKIVVIDKEKEAVEESFLAIEEEIESLRRIATEFSEFARMPNPQLEPGNINESVSAAVVLFEKNDRNIEIKRELSEGLPELELDQEQIKRVMINLIKNAVESTESGGGPVKVFTKMDASEKFVEIFVTDHGSGMDEETLNKMFDPYFTTKKAGTGLGMPIIKRIVEEHNGEISVLSKPGEGTGVTVILPVP